MQRNDTPSPRYIETTLLEIVSAVSEVAANDAEVVAVVDHLMRSGCLRLSGQFTERDFGIIAA